MMKNNELNRSTTGFILFKAIFYFMAVYFFLMGITLILVPQMITNIAGERHGIILGMLRGAGGSIIPYSIIYLLVATKPLERWLFAYILAVANLLAILLDLTSVFLREYRLSYAMFDMPFELISLIAIILFYRSSQFKNNEQRASVTSGE